MNFIQIFCNDSSWIFFNQGKKNRRKHRKNPPVKGLILEEDLETDRNHKFGNGKNSAWCRNYASFHHRVYCCDTKWNSFLGN